MGVHTPSGSESKLWPHRKERFSFVTSNSDLGWNGGRFGGQETEEAFR
jgi:hypothetical protein